MKSKVLTAMQTWYGTKLNKAGKTIGLEIQGQQFISFTLEKQGRWFIKTKEIYSIHYSKANHGDLHSE